MNAKDRKILAILAKAQSYSDSAKGSGYYAMRRNYDQKDLLIQQALRLLRGSKHSSLTWNFLRAPDQRGNDSHVLMVEFRDCGRKRQMSFHNFGYCPDQGTLSLVWNKKIRESAECAGFINRKEAKKKAKK